MGITADAAAVALVRAIVEQADAPLPRMQTRILNYLVQGGYVLPRGLPRSELRRVADHYGRSESLVRHQIVKLVRLGAVCRWQDEQGMVYFSYDPAWRSEMPEPGP